MSNNPALANCVQQLHELSELHHVKNQLIAAVEAELAEARKNEARYLYIRTEAMIVGGGRKRRNNISWPTIYAADPIEGGNYRDRFNAAIDAAMEKGGGA